MISVPGNSPPNSAHCGPGADHRDGEGEPGGDAQPGAGQQVVGQRVAGEAGEEAEEQQQHADDPVRLARLAEGAGEERAEHVHDHRGHEDQRRPVVDLPDEQAAAHVEGDLQRALERAGHVDAAQVLERAVVGDLDHRRVEEDRQVGARQQQHDEAVEGDLTEHERPVRREDLVELLPQPRRRVVPLVQLVERVHHVGVRTTTGGCRDRTHGVYLRSQKAGPTASRKSPVATR